MQFGYQTSDEPIIQSFLDTDFYEITMGDWIFSYPEYADAMVTFRLKCRTQGVKLGKVIPIEHLREELDHVANLSPTNTEIYYLRGMDIYGDRMLSESYLAFLKKIKLKLSTKYKAEIMPDGDLDLEFTGPWKTVLYWELFGLSIVNELYRRYLIRKHLTTRQSQERYFNTGYTNLIDKVRIFKQHPDLTYSDFGTRRRAGRDWQDVVVGLSASELPKNQFRGTSNVHLAMKHDLDPMGTSSHQQFMIAAGLTDIASNGNRDAIRASHNTVLRQWWEKYGYGLSIFLPDTFGTKFAFETMPDEIAYNWKGGRQDSGDPYRYGEKKIQWYQKHDVDPTGKIIVFSDGLTAPEMVKINNYFRKRVIPTFGVGTSYTNDFDSIPEIGLIPLSLVIKPATVNGKGLVKLSDNIAKAMGAPEDIERYRKIFDYDETYFKSCTY